MHAKDHISAGCPTDSAINASGGLKMSGVWHSREDSGSLENEAAPKSKMEISPSKGVDFGCIAGKTV